MKFYLLTTLLFISAPVLARNCTEVDVENYLTDDIQVLHCENLDINNPILFTQDRDIKGYRFKPIIINVRGRALINSHIEINGQNGESFYKDNLSSIGQHSRPGPGGVAGNQFTNPSCTQLRDCFTPFSTDAFRNLGHGLDGISSFTNTPNSGGTGGSLSTPGEAPTNNQLSVNNPAPDIVNDWRMLVQNQQGGRAGGAAFRGVLEVPTMEIEQEISLGGGGGGYLEIRSPQIILTSNALIDANGGQGLPSGADATYTFKGSGSGGGSGGVIYFNTSHFINESGHIRVFGGQGGMTFNNTTSTDGGPGGNGYILIGHLQGDLVVSPGTFGGEAELFFNQFNQYWGRPVPEKLDSNIATCSSTRSQESALPFIIQFISSFGLIGLIMKLKKLRTYSQGLY